MSCTVCYSVLVFLHFKETTYTLAWFERTTAFVHSLNPIPALKDNAFFFFTKKKKKRRITNTDKLPNFKTCNVGSDVTGEIPRTVITVLNPR